MDLIEFIEDLALSSTVCPRCEARPGEWCRTVSGKKAETLHQSRELPLYKAEARGHNTRSTRVNAHD